MGKTYCQGIASLASSTRGDHRRESFCQLPYHILSGNTCPFIRLRSGLDTPGGPLLVDYAAHNSFGLPVWFRAGSRYWSRCAENPTCDRYFDQLCDLSLLSSGRHWRTGFRARLVTEYSGLYSTELWKTCSGDGSILQFIRSICPGHGDTCSHS